MGYFYEFRSIESNRTLLHSISSFQTQTAPNVEFGTVHLRTDLDRTNMEHRWKQHKIRKAHKKISFKNVTLYNLIRWNELKLKKNICFELVPSMLYIFVLSRLVLRCTVRVLRKLKRITVLKTAPSPSIMYFVNFIFLRKIA